MLWVLAVIWLHLAVLRLLLRGIHGDLGLLEC